MKHTAFKLWVAAAVAIPVTLWLLSLLNTNGGAAPPLVVLAVLLVLAYIASGWLASRAALRLVPSLLHEAGLWERKGETARAEKVYYKALALYDSFLVSAKARRAGLPLLMARMARMYAAQADKQEDAGRFMERYLSAYPSDRDIAETWLQTREYQGGLPPAQQELAARIGDAHRDDAGLQMTLARLYLRAKRTDFPALQTYRRALADPRAASSVLASDLARIFVEEGRADEWALPVYLQASRRQPSLEALRCGIAACLRWIPLSERNAHWLAEAREILGDPEEDTLIHMSSGFVPPSGGYPLPEMAVDGRGRAPGDRFAALRHFAQQKHAAARRLARKTVDLLRQSPRLRHGVTWGAIAGLGILAALFIVHTIGYLAPSPTPPPATPSTPVPPQEVVAPSPPMPYTLQVAAYLKPEHAERYLKDLKGNGIEAYLSRAHANDKTWYQVRIAHFPSKADALAYGSALKAKGLIEDFYVAKDPAS